MLASSTTWLFVTMWPPSKTKKPEPEPRWTRGPWRGPGPSFSPKRRKNSRICGGRLSS